VFGAALLPLGTELGVTAYDIEALRLMRIDKCYIYRYQHRSFVWSRMGMAGHGRRFIEVEDHVLRAGERRGVGSLLEIALTVRWSTSTDAIFAAAVGTGSLKQDFNTPDGGNGAGYAPQTLMRHPELNGAKVPWALVGIGRDPVLDEVLRVSGVRLRVADKSITAIVPSGNSNRPTIVWRVAEVIAYYHAGVSHAA
jgi:hypothetical protein